MLGLYSTFRLTLVLVLMNQCQSDANFVSVGATIRSVSASADVEVTGDEGSRDEAAGSKITSANFDGVLFLHFFCCWILGCGVCSREW